MAKITIKTSTLQYEVIADGVIIIPSDSYVEFSISELTYRLRFANDDTERVHYTRNIVEQDTSNKYMEIVFYNIPSTLFTTPSNVIELGNIKGKKLCLRFSISMVHRENGSDFVLMYNWLIEK